MKGVIKNWLIVAVVFILTGIILGAFGAHALKEVLSENKLNSFDTAVRYQVWMGLGLAIQAICYQSFQVPLNRWSGRLLIAGILAFSFSIYLLVGIPDGNPIRSWVGPVTPLGGTLMIFSWALFLYQLIRSKSVK